MAEERAEIAKKAAEAREFDALLAQETCASTRLSVIFFPVNGLD